MDTRIIQIVYAAEQLSHSLSGELRTPTLIVWAADGPKRPVTEAGLFTAAIPNARRHIFPGLGDSGGQPALNHREARSWRAKCLMKV